MTIRLAVGCAFSLLGAKGLDDLDAIDGFGKLFHQQVQTHLLGIVAGLCLLREADDDVQ